MTTKKAPSVREAASHRSTSADFAASVLKGIIEHQDASSYFGSTGALDIWRSIARERGWITEAFEPTEAGRRHYAESGLELLPKVKYRRAYLWDWSCYTAAEEPAKPRLPPEEPPQSASRPARAKPAAAARAGRRTPNPKASRLA